MKSKMKKIFVAAFAAIALLTPQLHAQQSVAEKYVDKDGFAYSSNNGGYTLSWLEQIYKIATQKLMSEPEMVAIDKVFREFWKECNANAFGVSAVSGKELAPDFFVVKQFTEIPSASRTGFLWKLSPDSKTVPFVDVMPKNSLFCFGMNFNGSVIPEMLDNYVKKSGDKDAQEGYAGFLAECSANGFDFHKILNSVTGIAFYLEADPSRLIMPGFSSAAIIVAVKDRTMMDLIVTSAKKDNPDVVTANNEILCPTEFGALAVFQVGNYVVVTTDPAAAKNVISGKMPSLKQNPDYIKYSAGTPAAGNAFCFVSSELGKTVIPAYLPHVPAEISNSVDIAALCRVVGIGPALYSVSYSNVDGIGAVTNTGSKGFALFSADPALSSLATSLSFALIEFCKNQDDTTDFDVVE